MQMRLYEGNLKVKKTSLPVAVSASKTVVLKLPIVFSALSRPTKRTKTYNEVFFVGFHNHNLVKLNYL